MGFATGTRCQCVGIDAGDDVEHGGGRRQFHDVESGRLRAGVAAAIVNDDEADAQAAQPVDAAAPFAIAAVDRLPAVR